MNSSAKRVRAAAPALAVVMLGAMLGVNSARGPRQQDVRAYLDLVRASIEKLPYQIGDWAGKDIEPPPAAQKLLKPNKILQRRYTSTSSGWSVSLLIVHCADVRDMQGHYPPVCYPAHGWLATDTEDAKVQIDGSSYPAKRYGFRRSVQGMEQTISILGFFVVPDPSLQIVASREALDRVWQFGPGVGLGSGQIQVVADEGMPAAERRAVEEQFIKTIDPVIRTIAAGAQHARH